MQESQLDFYKRLAHAIALQFGDGCEVVVHDLQSADPDHSIVAPTSWRTASPTSPRRPRARS